MSRTTFRNLSAAVIAIFPLAAVRLIFAQGCTNQTPIVCVCPETMATCPTEGPCAGGKGSTWRSDNWDCGTTMASTDCVTSPNPEDVALCYTEWATCAVQNGECLPNQLPGTGQNYSRVIKLGRLCPGGGA
jgi:hypothetical protein